jgi:hypothetical protein
MTTEEPTRLPFDQLVEEQRSFRFDARSPLRAAEASADFEESVQANPTVRSFLEGLQQDRQQHEAANELWRTWSLALNRLDDARDLLFERLYEWSVVSSTTAVEVFVRGLLKYHLRTQLFRGDVALGEELLTQIMDRNGFRGVIPKMIKAAWNINLRSDPDWKNYLHLVEGRDKIVHTGVVSDDKTALIAIATCSRLIRRISELVQHHARLERLGSFLSSLVTESLDALDDDLIAVADHLTLKLSDTGEDEGRPA